MVKIISIKTPAASMAAYFSVWNPPFLVKGKIFI